MDIIYNRWWFCFISLLLAGKTYGKLENSSDSSKEIAISPFAYFQKQTELLSNKYTNNILDVVKQIWRYTKPVKKFECTTIFYQTEENLFGIIVKELLNSMRLTTEELTNSEVDSCNKVQNWLEKLVNSFETELCENIYINYKLFDIISVMCKETNKKVVISVEQIKDLIKPSEQLINECIEAIKNNDYINGDRKLKLITKDEHVKFIIKTVYNSSENNFEMILTFFNKINNARKIYLAYKFLYEEISIEEEPKGLKLYLLYKHLGRFINSKTYPDIEPDITLIRSNLRNKLINSVSIELLDSYTYKNKPIFAKSLLFQFPEIYSNFKDIYFKSFKLFLKKVCINFNCSHVNLIDFAISRNFYGEIILALKAIVEQLPLNDEDMLTFAYQIKLLSNISLESSQNIYLKLIIDGLPRSIKSLLFSKFVCLKNVAYNEYLITQNVTFDNFDLINKEQFVFTTFSESIPPNAIWEMKCPYNFDCKNVFFIENLAYNRVHLYASEEKLDSSYLSVNRSLFTKTFDNNLKHDLWIVEPFGNYCYIKNREHNSYMYVGDEVFYNKEHMPYLWIPNHSKINSRNFQWSIEDCTDYNYKINLFIS